MRNTAAISQQRDRIQKTMTSLMQALEKVAPHPDRPKYKGPLFTTVPKTCRSPSSSDSMVGMMMLEGMASLAFADAVSQITDTATHGASDSLDITATLQAYETYRSEIEGQIQHKAAHGQGTLARLSGASIKNSFNQRCSLTTAMQAFFDDMPHRMKIENQLAGCMQQLKALNVPSVACNEPGVRHAA